MQRVTTEPEPRASRAAGRLDRLLATRRGEALLVGAIVAVALVLRVVFVLHMRANPTFDMPVLDGEYHVEWARAIARGEDYYARMHGGETGPYFRAPLYPWFLGALFHLFGDGLLLPRLVQCGFGAATTLLAYAIGKRAFGARTALLAAAMTATYWVLIYFDGELLIETLTVPLYMLALLLTMRLGERRTRTRAVLAGLAWGVAAIARPNVLVFAPVVALWLVWLARRERARVAPPLAAFGLAFLAPVLPVTAVNVIRGNDFVLIASQGGVNFWIGNNPMSDGSTAIVPGTRGGWWQGYRDSIALAEKEEGRDLRPSEVSRFYARKAWAFLLGDPARSIPLLARKLWIFWIDYELGNNEDVRFTAHHFSPLPRWLPVRFAWLGPLSIVGLVLVLASRADRARLFPLWSFVLVYTASVVAFFVCSRFRVPLVPVLTVLASHAILVLAGELRARRTGRVAIAAAALVPAALLVNVVPSNLRRDDSNGYMQLGVAEWNRGHPERAIELLEKSVAVKASNSHAQTYLGSFLRQLDRMEEAIPHLQAALQADARNVDALEALLDLYFERGSLTELERTAADGRRLHPDSEIPYYHYGRMQLELARRAFAANDATEGGARLQAARAAFEEALVRAPGAFRDSFALGQTLVNLGQPRQAVAHYENALRRIDDAEAFEPQAFAAMLQCHERLGNAERACEIARLWLARRPQDPAARASVQKHCR